MFELARGREQVEALEEAIGSPLPAGAVEQAREKLLRMQAREREAQETAWVSAADSSRKIRELIIAQIAPEGSELAAEIASRRSPEPEMPPPFTYRESATEPEVEPRFAVGSIQLVKSAPYTDAFSATNGPHAEAAGDADRGVYGLSALSVGQGTSAATAGFCLAYHAPVTNPTQRVAAYVNTSWSWEEKADLYVAHNKAWTRLCVWGISEQRWLLVKQIEPAWYDSVSWFQDHHNSSEGEHPGVEGFFPAIAGRNYLVYVSSEGVVYADGGVGGYADSSVHLEMNVKFFAFTSS